MIQAIRGFRGGKPGKGSKTPTSTLAGSDQDEEYLTDITVGGQSFKVIVDTGSSDTWLAEVGFKCFDLSDTPQPAADCAFGTPGFDPSKSKTFVSYPDKNFNITYGDNEFLNGPVGFDTVTVGGLTVTKQEIGVVTAAAWDGDGVNTGLIGLAYPGITSVYNGSNPDDDSSSNFVPYDPFFFTAVKERKVSSPFFSIALDRGSIPAEQNSTLDPHLGYLAFGGIAPVPVTGKTTTVAVQGYTVSSSPAKEDFFYTVDVDSYVFPGSHKLATNGSAILDTGTTLNYVPTPIAKAFNKGFKPAAKYVEDEGTYYVDCNATAPDFAVTIGGVEFSVSGKDNILPIGADEKGKQLCISGTQDGGPDEDGNIFILGDTFLHNVVATFNIAANTISLTERKPY
ncbi:acid protease [Punctularia strigosozonata HHB-11173 SS5]|uniref:acid protease n=1 Tax=Punctularia strigosozonata (strain HHB-11173) TaxID=741275 RepID=UPI0004417316|nr:acid protease [Punctularia strigosozonata HHB-11173 SS5]EIN11164.1 acid protease [Punctularia strigosozonata HHB-11173 SS5]